MECQQILRDSQKLPFATHQQIVRRLVRSAGRSNAQGTEGFKRHHWLMASAFEMRFHRTLASVLAKALTKQRRKNFRADPLAGGRGEASIENVSKLIRFVANLASLDGAVSAGGSRRLSLLENSAGLFS